MQKVTTPEDWLQQCSGGGETHLNDDQKVNILNWYVLD